MYQHILLATDGSEHSHRAIEQTLRMVSPYEQEVSIDLIYVIDSEMSKSNVLHHGDSEAIAVKRKEMLSDKVEYLEAQGIQTETVLLHGSPADKIVAYANDRDYDCVVVGSRGRNKLQTFILGSVSHQVIKHVQAPVMMVK